MSSMIEKINKILPYSQTQESNRKRTLLWERWDTNSFGFLNILQIQQEICSLLQIDQDHNISLIVKRAFNDSILSSGCQNRLRGDYLEQRYFRLFLENFSKLMNKMLIFKLFDFDNADCIRISDQSSAQKILKMLKLDDQKKTKIFDMSTISQLSLQSFINWVHSLQNSELQNIN